MARVTVEDCLQNVKNRFELVLVAAKRARQLMLTGEEATVSWDNDKSTVVALREVAKGSVDASILDADDIQQTVAGVSMQEVNEQLPQVTLESDVQHSDSMFVVSQDS